MTVRHIRYGGDTRPPDHGPGRSVAWKFVRLSETAPVPVPRLNRRIPGTEVGDRTQAR
ncbi:hypothetical protein M2167_001062 [Streptomyces sp. SPB4]|nr:hypothetical protein [Streptomyces sp. SPB4]